MVTLVRVRVSPDAAESVAQVSRRMRTLGGKDWSRRGLHHEVRQKPTVQRVSWSAERVFAVQRHASPRRLKALEL